LVPQDSGVLLYHDTVAAECSASDRDAGLVAGTTRSVLDQIVPDIKATAHPRDLSEGQRLGLALSIVLASEPPLLLLDEPTRGLDYGAKQRLVEVLGRLAAEGHAVVIATHDVEVVAAVADRCVVLAEGEVVSDGSARDVVIHSPVFAPQVAKVLAPLPLLTVREVELALAAAGDLPFS
jgi:energy-coupling factor transport system ATP-binding protein